MIGGEGEENPIWMNHGSCYEYGTKLVSFNIKRYAFLYFV
jgi:hypothetical protein